MATTGPRVAEVQIVIDLGFGDSGKGFTVDHLAGQDPERSLVIRFSGGHQVGHTVRRDHFHHTFSNFGSGTYYGVPTYYLPETTIFPPGVLIERKRLRPICPYSVMHPLVMVTTPWDIAYNRARETVLQHGSCGVGFGATVERHLRGIGLFAKDLDCPFMIREKLRAIETHYIQRLANGPYAAAYQNEIATIDREGFIQDCRQVRCYVEVATPDQWDHVGLAGRDHLVFEGSQGILLDQVHGTFPHVTRANTTCENAMGFLAAIGYKAPVDIHYVTRCYQTRHGNGPMSDTPAVTLIHNEDEANVTNPYQGAFRTRALDPELLRYALRTDAAFHQGSAVRKHLMVTCLDQLPEFDVTALLAELEEFASVSVRRGAATDWKAQVYPQEKQRMAVSGARWQSPPSDSFENS